MTCNLRKASDIASLDPETGQLVALFNPREQRWSGHFKLEGATLVGLTTESRTTIAFLQLNARERLLERAKLIDAGVYPPKLDVRKPK